jgi:hypothetical protein
VPICSASLASYDPAVDPQGRALEVGLQLVELIAELATPAAGADPTMSAP